MAREVNHHQLEQRKGVRVARVTWNDEKRIHIRALSSFVFDWCCRAHDEKCHLCDTHDHNPEMGNWLDENAWLGSHPVGEKRR